MENKQIKNKKFKKVILAGVLVVSMITSAVTNQNVDAKKKNTKPKLTMKGKLKKNKITLKEGQSLPLKYTAKDKEDGNLTKKVKVKVTKPEDGEVTKTKKNIKFLKVGKYKLTFSVKDKKKKEAKKSVTVNVLANENINRNEPVNTVEPTPTSDNGSKVAPTTTEEPVTIKKEIPEVIKQYGEFEQITKDGVTYNCAIGKENISKDIFGKQNQRVDKSCYQKIEFDNYDFGAMKYDDNVMDLNSNYDFLKYFGNISVVDNYGVDVSNNIFMWITTLGFDDSGCVSCRIYFVDSKGDLHYIRNNEIYNNINTTISLYGIDVSYVANDKICFKYLKTSSKKKNENLVELNTKTLSLK